MRALSAMAKLAVSLGPWAGERVAHGATRTTRVLASTRDGERELRVHVYRPRARPLGAYLISPGLHYLGPDDPRCDRFCRALASAGFIVHAPFLPDYLALKISPRAADDLARAWTEVEAEARRESLAKPAIFSISFGSQPAIAIAALADMRDRVGALVLFGGFADFEASVRFAVTGHAESNGERLAIPFDPLNTPVVFLHLLAHLPTDDREALTRAWRSIVEATWGRTEMKVPGARDAIAREIAQGLTSRDRDLFLVGCGLGEGALALVDEGLLRAASELAFADPRPALASMTAPVAIVHGKDDDVIPWLEAEKLRRALPPNTRSRVLVTGLYGHTGAASPGLRALAGEARTMVGLLRVLVDAPRARL